MVVVRDVKRWLAETEREIEMLERGKEGIREWEREFSTVYPGPTYLLTMILQAVKHHEERARDLVKQYRTLGGKVDL